MRAFVNNPGTMAAALLADQAPIGEATAPVSGAGDKASRMDHRHPRLTSARWQTTNASGEATFTFTRIFADEPIPAFSYREAADNMPIIFKVKEWVKDANGAFIGMVAKGYRLQPLPSTLLNISVLVNFSVSTNAPAGIPVACVALQAS